MMEIREMGVFIEISVGWTYGNAEYGCTLSLVYGI